MARVDIDRLLLKVAKGDNDAFEYLYLHTYKGVFAFLYTYLHNYADTEDAMQTTFLKIKRGISSYRAGTNGRAWILQIAKNHALNELAQYDVLVENAETVLVRAGETANQALDTAKASLKTAYDAVVATIAEYADKVSKYAAEIANKQKETQTAFFTSFETNYAAAIQAAKDGWSAMQSAAQQKESEPAA